MIPDSFLADIRDRTSLKSLIGQKVELRRSGREWVGLCPFHNENTPSFHVYPDHYFCFGCQARGDAIDFVRLTKRLDFHDAVELLAEEAGLQMPGPAEEHDERQRLYAQLDQQAKQWARTLHSGSGKGALRYIRDRGISLETIERFGIGWADATTTDFLFRNRLIFPIHDSRGRVISFSGRLLTEDLPKYVNGPESPIFSKGRSLFGLWHARQMEQQYALVLAEGQIDAIALQQSGVAAAAPLGSSLSAEQLLEAWKSFPAIILAFDGDKAGRAALNRALDVAVPHIMPERTIRVAVMPDGQDPASLIQRDPAWARSIVDGSIPLLDVLFDRLKARHHGASPEAKASLVKGIDAVCDTIRDRALGSQYRWAMRGRLYRKTNGSVGKPMKGRPLLEPTQLALHLEALDAQKDEVIEAMTGGQEDDKNLSILLGLEAERDRVLTEGLN